MKVKTLQALDHSLNWHPCSQMQDYEDFKPLVITKAYDCYLELQDGSRIIDAVSSWWCKSLGHNHPRLKYALLQQLDKFEHVIYANSTNELIVALSQQLTNLSPHLHKVFYAGDGSSAVEIALKMSLHYRQLQGDSKRKRFVALRNGYHGETLATMSVSDCHLYRQPYQSLLFEPLLVTPPYINSMDDAVKHGIGVQWQQLESSLLPHLDEISAIIVEPMIQGVAGMRLYSADFLEKLANFAKVHGIHVIADEIMTGLGRTGKMLACEHASIEPDFVCLGKGLSSGWVPFSAVLTTNAIYDAFYDDYESGKAFLHSHTYSGNALGASVALATLQELQEKQYCERAVEMQVWMRQAFVEIAEKTESIHNIRGVGAIIAADLVNPQGHSRLGYHLFQESVKLGAWLRPLGNTLYWLPPLNISYSALEELKNITLQALLTLKKSEKFNC